MTSGIRNFLIGIGIAFSLGVAAGGYYWMTEPQQLQRACVAATLEHLVSPSTYKFVGSKITPPGDPSLISVAQLDRVLEQAKTKLDAAKTETARASKFVADTDADVDKLSKEMEKRHLPGYGSKEFIDKVKNGRLEVLAKATKDETDAQINFNTAKQARDTYVALSYGEIVLTFDSQNRASAMIRSQSLCVYSPEHVMQSEIASVRVTDVAESGQLLQPK